jgi:hypothetical protein
MTHKIEILRVFAKYNILYINIYFDQFANDES